MPKFKIPIGAKGVNIELNWGCVASQHFILIDRTGRRKSFSPQIFRRAVRKFTPSWMIAGKERVKLSEKL